MMKQVADEEMIRNAVGDDEEVAKMQIPPIRGEQGSSVVAKSAGGAARGV